MSIDSLQEKIRKLKNPSVVDFNLLPEHIPAHIQERDTFFVSAYEYFCGELLQGLQETVPAVRFSMSMLSLYGVDGMVVLGKLLKQAKDLGYYVLLDAPSIASPVDAQRTAELLFGDSCELSFDGLVLDAYIGSDALRPLCEKQKTADKDVFVLVRTPNKSASDLQDLLTGSRHVHTAAADIVNRFCEGRAGKSGYAPVAAVMAANNADSLRNLRSKHKSVFMLVDGYDYNNANAKNCSYAFDPLGYGAAACAGVSVTAAWQECPADEREFVRLAKESAERMKKNLTRYVTIL